MKRLIPTHRLLIWFGLIFLPVSLSAAIVPTATMPGVGVGAVLMILILIDAVVSKNRLSGIRIGLPEVIRLSVSRESEIRIFIENNNTVVKRLRVGLAFPQEIYSSYQDLITDLPGMSAHSSISWPFKALKQGKYFLENCYLETSSVLGFWSIRRTESTGAEIRVYPDLFRERKALCSLFLKRSIGIHSQRQVGKGREFEQLREYLPGDSYEDIHWKATARRDQPITKVYQIERTQQIYVLIDGSRLSARNSDPHATSLSISGQKDVINYTTIMERFVAAALIMGLAADRQGDLFGLLAFDDRVRRFVRAKNGKAHYEVCRDTLYTLQAQRVSPDFTELFTFVATHIRRRALLIILTCLDDPVLTQSFTTNIDLISRQHIILVNILTPAETGPLFSNPSVNSVEGIYRKLGSHLLWKHLRETEKFLQRGGIGFHLLANENLSADIVSQYLTIKRRQVL